MGQADPFASRCSVKGCREQKILFGSAHDFVIVYQNKDDVSPSDFPKGSRLEAKHRLDVVGEPLGTVTPAHAHSLHKH
jgi:hypothetical protein